EEEEEAQNGQEIWSWGAGTDGQLATGKLQDEFYPQRLRNLRPIASLSCGGAHAIALCKNGRVLTWGRGSSGQLGHGETAGRLHPTAVKTLENSLIVDVSAGWNHSAFVSEDGGIFTCGDGSFGKLGHGNHTSQCFPLQLSHFARHRIKKVACGTRHTLVLLGGKNQVYAFGAGKRGQLGISTNKSESTPRMTSGFTNLKISNVYANGDHSAALSGDGILYQWGRGFDSGCDEYVPRKLDLDSRVSDVALGWNHALLLTEERKVIMVGGNRHGILGGKASSSSSSSSSSSRREIVLPGGSRVGRIAAGAEHSAMKNGGVCVAENGRVVTWGWGEHGQLGLGDGDDRTIPQTVPSFDADCCGRRPAVAVAVYCGSGFSFLLR
ncbi:hypothetical protein M569_06389, partial [Genlisea aurea]